MVKTRPLGAYGALAALILVAGCAGGAGTTRATTLPDAGVRPNDHANRVVSSRGRQYAAKLDALRDRPVQQSIDEAAAHGARVFRVPTYVITDPATHASYHLPKTLFHHTPNGIVIDGTAGPVRLSHAAQVSSTPQYSYVFVHGPHDPDPAMGAVRVR